MADRVDLLPDGMIPVVIAGGSFHSSGHSVRMREEDKALIDTLLNRLDPATHFFVIGHRLTGQEGYLVKQNRGRFRIFAFVPAEITAAEQARLRESGVSVRVSIESAAMGIYKSFSYEIFNRRPSVLLAFDGNSAALNLVQEARNGKEKCRIYLNTRSRGLAAKASVLEGYVQPLAKAPEIADSPAG